MDPDIRLSHVRRFGRALGFAAAAGALVQCSQQQGGTPVNLPLRTYVREIYHVSPYTIRSVFNLTIAAQVWDTNPILAYDSSFHGSEYRGELGGCKIAPYPFPSAALAPPTYTLYQDSGFFYDQETSQGPQPYGDAIALYQNFRSVGDSVIPVFIFPRLVFLKMDGTNLFHGFYGETWRSGIIFPSIWMNSRGLNANPQPAFPGSTLAHELAHIALTSLDPRVWSDDSTPFLHILTHPGVSKLARQSSGAPGPVTSVIATDVNRRNLIRFGFNDACLLAKINFVFARPVLP